MHPDAREGKNRVDTRTHRFLLALIPLVLPAAVLAQSISEYSPGTAAPLCVPDAHTLCLNDARFSVTAAFQLTPLGPTIQATAVPMTADTGYFWFFDDTNVELVAKVLNGCALPLPSYWFFAAGLTNLGVMIEVTDLQAHVTRTYTNPIGTPFVPIQDTGAFGTCP